MTIHAAGVQHNDIRSANLRRKDEDDGPGPWIIDFGHAEKHTCGRTRDIIEGEIGPDDHEFGCLELWELCLRVGVWRSRTYMMLSIIL